MSGIIDQLDISLHGGVTIDVLRIPRGGLLIRLGEPDHETVRILASDAAAERLTLALDSALTGQGDDA